MQPLVVALVFAMVFVACCYAALKGARGLATDRSEGYGDDLPDHMLTDPAQRKKINRMVFLWTSSSAALCLPPIAYLAYILADAERQLSTLGLVLLAIYGLAVAVMAGYPFEKIKSYGKS